MLGLRVPVPDNSLRVEAAHERVVDVPGMDLAVDLGFADAACDELRVLGAEIEDEDLLMLHFSRLLGYFYSTR